MSLMPLTFIKIFFTSFAFFLILLIPLFPIYRFWFFLRDPERNIPKGNNILAPADGFVIYIKDIKNNEVPLSIKKGKKIFLNELINDSKISFNLVIGIFMTPFSVHYNRFPFSGVITKIIYKNSAKNYSMLKGFLNIIFNLKPYSENADYVLENEKNILMLKNDYIEAAVVQIADKWVSKIKNKVFNIHDFVNKGEKIGLIRMGSQCDLFLNIKKNYNIIVKERDYVKAGSSVLIEISE